MLQIEGEFLQPLQVNDYRQGERNPWVFLKAKVIQACSKLNPDRRDEFFYFPGILLRSWISTKLILRNIFGLDYKGHQLQIYTHRNIALATTFHHVAGQLQIFQAFSSSVTTLLSASFLIQQLLKLGRIRFIRKMKMMNRSLHLIPVRENQLSWTAQICHFGHSKETFCRIQRLPHGTLDTTWSAPCLVDLI